MTKTLLVDQDGVLADFEGGVFGAYQAKFGAPFPTLPNGRKHFYIADDFPELKREVQAIFSAKGFFENLAPIDGAQDALRQLLDAGLDVRICTSPIDDYRHCVGEKFAWIEKHLGFEWTKRVVLTKDKTWVRGDVLIDDKPHVRGSLPPLWEHWHYLQSYNAHLPGKKVVWTDKSSWQALLE